MEETVKQRLVAYLREKGIGWNKFEKQAGVSNGYIANLLHAPGSVILEKILAAAPDLSRTWLLTGEGAMLKAAVRDETVNDRIASILKDIYGGNVTAMAKGTFIPRSTINSIVGPAAVSPGFDVIYKIGEMSSPRISMEWLVRGEGDMYFKEDFDPSPTSDASVDTSPLVPLLAKKDEQIDRLLALLESTYKGERGRPLADAVGQPSARLSQHNTDYEK